MSDLLYLYGLIPTKEANKENLPSMKGFDGESELYTIEIGDVTAIVCDLPSNEYSEETIKEKVDNDMDWLQEKAFPSSRNGIDGFKVVYDHPIEVLYIIQKRR